MLALPSLSPPDHLEAMKAGMHLLTDLGVLGIPWPFGGTVSTKSYLASNADPCEVPEGVCGGRPSADGRGAAPRSSEYSNMDDQAVAEQTWEIFSKRYDMPPYPTREGMEAVIQYSLVDTDPKAKDIPPQEFYDDRLLRELEQSGFVKQVTGS